jgi:hypothetical protein
VSQVYPVHIARQIDSRWKRRARPNELPLARNDNHAGGGRCPACGSVGLTAPTSSEYRGSGFIDHHWQCSTCGYEWVTAQSVPT